MAAVRKPIVGKSIIGAPRLPPSGPSAPVLPTPPIALPQLPILTASQSLRQAQIQQAQPAATAAFDSGYRWAVLNVAVIIGGHTFPAGTRIVVAPLQTSKSVIGKAHTSVTVTKVWVKFGQTFDSSSWIQGAISASLYTLTGQTAMWNSSTGFGAEKAGLGTPSTAEGVVIASGLAIGGGLIGYYVGGKKYHWLGAGIGALAGLVVVPAVGSLLLQK